MLRVGVRRNNESQNYTFLQYVDFTWPIDLLNKTLDCVSLKRSTDEEEDRSLRQSTESSAQGDLSVREWIGRDLLETPQD